MENQVLSIEQMQELIKLGMDVSSASMYQTTNKMDSIPSKLVVSKDYALYWMENCGIILSPTFTLQDILNIMPNNIKIGNISHCYLCLSKQEGSWICSYNHSSCDGDDPIIENWGSTPLEAAFIMLKYCKQNNYL